MIAATSPSQEPRSGYSWSSPAERVKRGALAECECVPGHYCDCRDRPPLVREGRPLCPLIGPPPSPQSTVPVEPLTAAVERLLASADLETGEGIAHPWYSVPPTHIDGLRAILAALPVPDAPTAREGEGLRAVLDAAFDRALRLYVRSPEDGADEVDAHLGSVLNSVRDQVIAAATLPATPTGIDPELVRAYLAIDDATPDRRDDHGSAEHMDEAANLLLRIVLASSTEDTRLRDG